MSRKSNREPSGNTDNNGHSPKVNNLIEDAPADEFDEIFDRARQIVKPIVNEEAINEMVGEDILNFRMD